jgi:hypothetical protein
MYVNPRMTVAPQDTARPVITFDALAGYLLPVSTIYLAMPHLIFYFGWLQWSWAILAIGIICVALVIMTRTVARAMARTVPQSDHRSVPAANAPSSDSTSDSTGYATLDATQEFVFTRQHALMIGAVCLLWLAISGVGGFVRQDYDWEKHNVIFNSLILKPWPTVYQIYGEPLPLVYYIGYYLPAALVGKIGGWFWANQALFIWSFAGLFVAVTWFCILVRRVSYSVLILFVLFSGLDVIGKSLATAAGFANAGEATWRHIDPWAGIFQYSSNSTLLFWVPHQALGGWVLAGVVLYCLVTLRRRDFILLPVGLSTFWSPFVTLGVLPYLVIDFLVGSAPLGRRIRQLISWPNAAGIVAAGTIAFYFSTKAYAGSPVVDADLMGGLNLPHYHGSLYRAIAFLLFFCFLEFGIYTIILYLSGAIQDKRWRWILGVTVLILCVLPWFRIGIYNDLVMRASIPTLFALAVVVARAVHEPLLGRRMRAALLVVLLIGAYTPATEMARHAYRMVKYLPPILDETQAPGDLVDYFQAQAYFFGQYSGGIESPFFQYAAKPAPVDVANAPGVNHATGDHDYILYDNKIYLVRDQVELAPEIAAGATVTTPLELHFYGPAINSVYQPTARLVDDAENTLWRMDAWPHGSPPTYPYSMTVWIDTITVTVPVTATPGLYDLEVGFYDVSTNGYLPAYSVPEGLPLGEMVPVDSVRVMRDE